MVLVTVAVKNVLTPQYTGVVDPVGQYHPLGQEAQLALAYPEAYVPAGHAWHACDRATRSAWSSGDVLPAAAGLKVPGVHCTQTALGVVLRPLP